MMLVSEIDFKSPRFYAQLAIVPGLIGILLLLCYWITNCAACGRKNRYITMKQLRRTTATLGLFGLVAVACAVMLVVINNQDISDGINMAFDVSADVESRFHGISDDCISLRDSGHAIVDATHNLEQTCEIESKELNNILNSVTDYLPNLEDASKDTNHVANNIGDARQKSDPYARKGRSAVLWGIFTIVISIVFLNVIAFLISTGCCKNQRNSLLTSMVKCFSLSIVRVLSFVLFLILTLIVIINMYGFFVVEAFCRSPNSTVLELVPEGTIYNYTSYYSTSCDIPAPNPVMDELADLQDELSSIESSLNEITKACGNSVDTLEDIKIIRENLDRSVSVLGDVQNMSDCEEIHTMYVKILNQAICHDVKHGLVLYFGIVLACTLSILAIIFLLMMRRDQKTKRDAFLEQLDRLEAADDISGTIRYEHRAEQAQISDEDYQRQLTSAIPTAPVLLSEDGIPVDCRLSGMSAPLLQNSNVVIGGDF